MDNSEISKQLAMPYAQLVEYLLNKYGPAKYDFFVNESCKTKNRKVTRTSEGLYCHHIDEDKAIMLSDPSSAKNNPFSYQKADRLVYCNALEHLILHAKIMEESKLKDVNEYKLQGIGGVIVYLCPQINDYYNGFEYKRQFEKNIYSVIANNFDGYIEILRYMLDKIAPLRYEYSIVLTKETLCKSFVNNKIVDKIYEAI